MLIKVAVNARCAEESVRAVDPTVTGSAPDVASKLVLVSSQHPIIPEVRAVVALPLFRAWFDSSAASTERFNSLVLRAIWCAIWLVLPYNLIADWVPVTATALDMIWQTLLFRVVSEAAAALIASPSRSVVVLVALNSSVIHSNTVLETFLVPTLLTNGVSFGLMFV